MNETGQGVNENPSDKSVAEKKVNQARIVTGVDGKTRKIGRLVQPASGNSGRTANTSAGKTTQNASSSRYSDKNQETESPFRVKRAHTSSAVKVPAQEVKDKAVRNNRQPAQVSETVQPADAFTWKEKLQKRKKRRRNIVLAVIGLILVGAYSGVAIYYGSHFYKNTTIFGLDCSLKTLPEVKAEVEEKLQDYVLTIKERKDVTEQLSAGEVGLKYDDDGSIDKVMRNQFTFIWPVMMFLDHNEDTSVSFAYDDTRAETSLNLLDCMNPIHMEAPKDAYMEINDQGFAIIEEVMGTKVDKEKVTSLVKNALDTGKTEISLEDGECYINPTVFHDDEEMNRIVEEKNRLAGANITFHFGNNTEVVDPKLLDTWLVQLADGSYVLDDMAVTNFVDAMAQKYDTLGTEREFKTSVGTVVTLYYGDYGWSMNAEATVLKLLRAIEEGYHGDLEPEYYQTAAWGEDGNDLGGTYVEINISQQTMWCYKDGNLEVMTPVVTGNPNKDNATPSWGVWAIDEKRRNATLVGENYSAPVDFWLPFNGNVGIHDLQSRYAYGGTIYQYEGSHGCVNTPYDAVRLIYNAVSIGSPVVVYGE